MEISDTGKKKPCPKCNDYGRYQSYIGGMVVSVYCECAKGQAWLKRIEELVNKSGAINNESNE